MKVFMEIGIEKFWKSDVVSWNEYKSFIDADVVIILF